MGSRNKKKVSKYISPKIKVKTIGVSTAVNNHPTSWIKVILICGFAFLFGFHFASDLLTELADTHTKECDVRADSNLLSHREFVSGYHHHHHFPFGSDSSPVPEVPEENELTDRSDDELDKLYWTLCLRNEFNPDVEKPLLLQLTVSVGSRQKVSLFILHHSWKSFLA